MCMYICVTIPCLPLDPRFFRTTYPHVRTLLGADQDTPRGSGTQGGKVHHANTKKVGTYKAK